MKLFPTLSGDKATIFEKASCTLLTRFSSTLFDRKTEIRKYSVETPPTRPTHFQSSHSPHSIYLIVNEFAREMSVAYHASKNTHFLPIHGVSGTPTLAGGDATVQSHTI